MTTPLPDAYSVSDAIDVFNHEFLYSDDDVSISRCDVARLIVAVRPDVRDHVAASLSLCPLHLIDAAICADDDDDECRSDFNRVYPNRTGYDT